MNREDLPVEVLEKELPKDFFAPTFEELCFDYAIPSAFGAYKP